MKNIFRHMNLNQLYISYLIRAQFPCDFIPSFQFDDSRLSYEELCIKPRESLIMS